MSVKELAATLVRLCKEGKNTESVQTLYADEVESIEAAEAGGFARLTRGKQAVLDKNVRWGEMHEIHRADVRGPYSHGDSKFAVHFDYEVTHRASKQRMAFDEIAVFTVADGKVVKEEFFYDVG